MILCVFCFCRKTDVRSLIQHLLKAPCVIFVPSSLGENRRMICRIVSFDKARWDNHVSENEETIGKALPSGAHASSLPCRTGPLIQGKEDMHVCGKNPFMNWIASQLGIRFTS